jgi:non-ribosomal peptide synthetase component F
MFAAFADAAARDPSRAALACGVTAGQLCAAALHVRAALAAQLPAAPPVRAPGAALVPLPHVVCVALPRSADYLAALLGVLAAGGAWLAVDARWCVVAAHFAAVLSPALTRRPGRPRARLAAVLADAQPSAVLVACETDAALLAAALADAAAPPCGAPLCLDALPLWSAPAPPPPAQPAPEAAIANVCYTSGSSGAPKGVLGTAAGLRARCDWAASALPAAPDDVAALRTPPPFVDAAAEALAPLLAGVPLAVVPPSADADPSALVALLVARHVTRLTLLPSLLAAALPALASAQARGALRLRLLLCSGEPLPAALAAAAARALPRTRLLNVYGSTEVGADATAFDLQAELWQPPQGAAAAAGATVPVGRPLPGVWAAVLDACGAPVREAGQEGDLLVGGVGVAAGFLNAPELSEARFPLVAGPGGGAPARAHRTGDRAAWLPCGALALRGRADAQVKLRGQRVSLDDVEAALCAHPAVAAAAVRLWHRAQRGADADADAAVLEPRIGAHVVLRQGKHGAEADALAALREWLEQRLLPAALPAALVALPALPRTAGGKVDRAALLEPRWPDADATDAAGAAAQSPTLARLCAAFGAALGAAGPLRPEADFFAAGGTSLSAALLCGRLALPLQALLDHPTPRALAEAGLTLAPPPLPDASAASRTEDRGTGANAEAPPVKRLRLPPDSALDAIDAAVSGAEADAAWSPALALSFAGRCDAIGRGAPPALPQPAAAGAPAPWEPPAAELACAWRVPLRACVDASPLVLLPEARGDVAAAGAAGPPRWRAVIGSHAHAVLCVEFDAPGTPARSARPMRTLWSADVGCAPSRALRCPSTRASALTPLVRSAALAWRRLPWRCATARTSQSARTTAACRCCGCATDRSRGATPRPGRSRRRCWWTPGAAGCGAPATGGTPSPWTVAAATPPGPPAWMEPCPRRPRRMRRAFAYTSPRLRAPSWRCKTQLTTPMLRRRRCGALPSALPCSVRPPWCHSAATCWSPPRTARCARLQMQTALHVGASPWAGPCSARHR